MRPGGASGEELRLAAEMGQMLIAQKKQLQEELDTVAGERDRLREELREWTSLAGQAGERSASGAMAKLRHAEERADGLQADAAQRSQRIVQLEVQVAELESVNADLALEAQASGRQALELKKAQERLKVMSDASALAAQLERELVGVRGEKQRLSDKMTILEADCRQYQEELRNCQEMLEKVRAECRKLKQAREGADVQAIAAISSTPTHEKPVQECTEALEMVETMKLEMAAMRLSAQAGSDADAALQAYKAKIEAQSAEIQSLKAEIDSLRSQPQTDNAETEEAGQNRAATPNFNSTNPFDTPSQQEELAAATQEVQQVKKELDATKVALQTVQCKHEEHVQELKRQHEAQMQLSHSALAAVQAGLRTATATRPSLQDAPHGNENLECPESTTDATVGREFEHESAQDTIARLQAEVETLRAKPDCAMEQLSGESPHAGQAGELCVAAEASFGGAGSDIEAQFAVEAARSRGDELQRQAALLQEKIREVEGEREAVANERDALIQGCAKLEERAQRAEQGFRQLETVGRFLETVNLELMAKIRVLEATGDGNAELGAGWKRLGDVISVCSDEGSVLGWGEEAASAGEKSSLLISSTRSRRAAIRERRSRSPKKKEIAAPAQSEAHAGGADSPQPPDSLQPPALRPAGPAPPCLHDLVKQASEGVPAPLDVHVEGT